MVDDLINEVMTSPKSTYDKEAFIKKKSEQQKSAFEIINSAVESLKTDTSFLQEYLNIQSRFDKYTPRNALLVAKQNSEATQLKERADWIKDRVNFNSRNPKIILVLEPGNRYVNKEGKTITNWFTKELIDVSETNVKPNVKNYDNKIVFQAVVNICKPIVIKAVDSLDSGQICEYNQADKTIYVCRKPDYDSLVRGLVVEVVKMNLSEKENTIDNDKLNCISYMFCRKYGVDFPINGLENITQKYSTMDSKEIISDLTIMKDITLSMNNKVMHYLEDRKKEAKNQYQER